MSADPRPSRWLSQGWNGQARAHTLGDNALRALARMLMCDPRRLIGRDPQAAWTDVERQATATSLATWWQAQQGRSVEQIQIGAVPTLDLVSIANVLKKLTPEQRSPFLAAVAKQWASKPPVDPEPAALAGILVASADDAAITALVKTWSVQGKARWLLVAWHLRHDDLAPIDGVLADMLEKLEKTAAPAAPAPGNKPDDVDTEYWMPSEHAQEMLKALAIIRRYPKPAYVTRLLGILNAPVEQPATAVLMESLLMMNEMPDEIALIFPREQHAGKTNDTNKEALHVELCRQQALTLALFAVLLHDQRPVSAVMKASLEKMSRFMPIGDSETKPDPAKQHVIATDLRIADYAGTVLRYRIYQWELHEIVGQKVFEKQQQLQFDLTAPKASRDAVLKRGQALLAEALPECLRSCLET